MIRAALFRVAHAVQHAVHARAYDFAQNCGKRRSSRIYCMPGKRGPLPDRPFCLKFFSVCLFHDPLHGTRLLPACRTLVIQQLDFFILVQSRVSG